MPVNPVNPDRNNKAHLVPFAYAAYRRFSKEKDLYLDHKDFITIPVQSGNEIVNVNVAIHHGYLVAYPELKTTVINSLGEREEIKIENPYQELIFPAQTIYQNAKGPTRKAIVSEIAKAAEAAADSTSSDRKQAIKQLKPELEKRKTVIFKRIDDVPFSLEPICREELLTVAAICKLTGKLPPPVDVALKPGSGVYVDRRNINIFDEKQSA